MAKQDYKLLEIDLMKLYTEGTNEKWNSFLDDCYQKKQIDRLLQTRIGLQVGMATLAKKKLNSEKICTIYLRWMKSIESTARKVLKDLNPMPTDVNPTGEFATAQWVEAKRKRDNAFEVFILKSSY